MSHPECVTSQPVIIAGMHRSGTSLVASVLEKAGVHIGEELLGANTSNPKGHFEDVEFLSLHQDILFSQGLSDEGWTALTHIAVPQQFWGRAQTLCQQRSAATGLWGWKEPRTTLFLDFWEKLLPNAKFVFVYRSPWEVMNSLYTRGNTTFHNNPKFAIEVWKAYNQAILNFHHQCSEKIFLLHALALRQGENQVIAQIAEKLGLPLEQLDTRVFEAGEMHLDVNNTHRPTLVANHYPQVLEIYQRLEEIADISSQEKLSDLLPLDAQNSYQDWVFQDWQSSCRASELYKQAQSNLQQIQGDFHQSQGELQHVRKQLQQLQDQHQHLQTQLQHTQSELQQAHIDLLETQAQLNHAKLVIESMESSKFWQLRAYWFALKDRLKFRSNETSNV